MNVSCFRDDAESPRRRTSPTVDNINITPETPGKTQEPIDIPVNDDKTDEGVNLSIAESPKHQPTAFVINFDDGKDVDTSRFENLLKKSQARHQRVQSMSASWQRPSPANGHQQRPPMSAKLPRKAHGYHSEGYFSSDQEDSFVGSSKLRQNQIHHESNKKQLHNNNTGGNFTPVSSERESFRNRHSIKSENTFSPSCEKRNPFDKSPDSYYSAQQKNSKSPVADSIMTRSDILPSRQGLNLPLKHPHTTASVNRTSSDMVSSPNCATPIAHSYVINSPYLIEQSPNEVPMLADMSSPELDMLTPDNLLQTPGTPVRLSSRRNSSGPLRSFSPSARNHLKSPGMTIQQMVRSPSLNRKFNNGPADGETGNISPSSTVSEAGTYTIEANHYTEEQKAKMNIDEIFGTNDFKEPLRQALNKMHKTSPKKENADSYVITTEPRLANFSSSIREELLLAKTIPDPVRKVSTDKNVLEISCCYESPTESNEPPQIAKPSKSAKSYLDKIKSRVKNISEKTFQKVPKTPEASVDVGSFTSVTASGVLGSTLTISQRTPKSEDANLRERLTRKNSLTKSQIDSNEYVHRMPNSNLVLQNVSNESFLPTQKSSRNMVDDVFIKSPAGLSKSLIVDDGVGAQTQEQIIVGRLSNISLNRCQGDKSWIREWADSVKQHNREMGGEPEIGITGLPPVSPRHSAVMKGISNPSSACSSPSKIPSPVGTMIRQRAPIPDILSSTPDTESFLLNTQNAISNLQAKLHQATYNSSPALPDKFAIPSKLPVSQLSRSNSLNYRLHKRTNPSSTESSPLRNPGRYLITGNNHLTSGARPLLSHTGASKSLDTDTRIYNWKEELRNQKNNDHCEDFDWDKYKETVLSANLRLTEPLHVKEDIVNKAHENGDKKFHSRHKSFDGRSARDFFNNILQERDSNNIMTRSLNANVVTEGVVYAVANVRGPIDQTRGNLYSAPSNQRVSGLRNSTRKSSSGNVSPQNKNLDKTHLRRSSAAANGPMSSPIRRSSSFNVVNKANNNNNYDNLHSGSKNILGSPVVSRVDSGLRNSDRRGRTDGRMQRSCELSVRNNTPEVDYMSEDSDNLSTGGFYSDYDRRSMRRGDNSDILAGARCNRAFALRRARIASPDLRLQHSGGGSSGSPRCPGTPEMRRKFANEDIRTRTRDSRSVTRKSDNAGQGLNDKDVNAAKVLKSRKVSESGRPSGQVTTRMTRSSSTTKEFQPKTGERNVKKPNAQVIAAQAKDLEFTNWKKRASYDPMKAAQEGKKRNPNANVPAAPAQVAKNVRRSEADEVVSPSHSSPVHRSRSFNCTGGLPLSVSAVHADHSEAGRGSPDTDEFEDRLVCTVPAEGAQPVLQMISGTDSGQVVRRSRRTPQSTNVTLANDYVPKFQINQQPEVLSPRSRLLDAEKRKTHLIENSEILHLDQSADNRRPVASIPNHHLLLDSDTGNSNSTTNGSGGSRRNSSNYSDQENVGQTGEERLSDSEDVESDNDRRNKDSGVVMRGKSRSVPPQQRHSGDFSMSSSTTSASKDLGAGARKTSIQPRYLDISKYKTSEPSPAKNFLRRDPSKTYVGVLPSVEHRQLAKRNTAKQEQEMKNKELEKWKRRASYDPRKAAAQAKLKPTNVKSPSSSVLRSQSFHGPMTHTNKMSISCNEKHNADQFYADALSDNEF